MLRTSLVLILLFLILNLIGLLFSKLFLKKLRSFDYPVLGLSSFFILSSNLFLLDVDHRITIILLSILSMIAIRYVKKEDLFKILLNLVIFLSTTVVFLSTYLFVFGFDRNITGYNICNDSVVHATFSRNPEDNYLIEDKVEGRYYPRAVHSGINLISNVAHEDTSKLVIPMGIYFYAFAVFPLIRIVELFFDLKKSNSRFFENKLFLYGIPIISLSTYYSLAIAFHGFLTQVSYLSFVFLIPFYINYRKLYKKDILLMLLVVASIISYGPAASIIIFAEFTISFLYTLFGKVRLDIKVLVMKLLVYITLGLLFAGVNLIDLFHVALAIVEPGGEAQSSIGNLVGKLDLDILTGVWDESDYRIVTVKDTFVGQAFLLMNSLFWVVLGSLICRIKKLKNNRPLTIVIFSLVFAYLFMDFYSGNPYMLSKLLTPLTPALCVLFLLGIIYLCKNWIVKYSLLLVYLLGFFYSNYVLMSNITVLPYDSLFELDDLRTRIENYDSVLFHTSNDWAVYYVDSSEVDIKGIHYFQDTNFKDIVDYDLIVYDTADIPENSISGCLIKESFGKYILCKN